MQTAIFTEDDVAYIEEHFISLESQAPGRPAASYALDDGREFYPKDYFELEADETAFKERLALEARAQGIAPLDAGEEWEAYIAGIYGICLRSATPENIARKAALLQHIEALTGAPDEEDPAWIRALKDAVDALDALERPFSPHYDRRRFGRPPTRDSHIAAVRARFPQIAQGAAG